MHLSLNIVINRIGSSLICPWCGMKTFRQYVDIVTKEVYEGEYGFCERGKKCGYNLMPRIVSDNKSYIHEEELLKLGYEKHDSYLMAISYNKIASTIPSHRVFHSMVNGFEETNFAKFLISHLNYDAIQLLRRYYVGHNYDPVYPGKECENVFWRIDNNFNVRHGLTTDYLINGKRISAVPQDDSIYGMFYHFSFCNCFFGANLINVFPEKDIAIVEDEKTAIVCSYFWPEYNWLATGEIESLNWVDYQVYNVLIGKNITIFSDYSIPVLITSKIDKEYWDEMGHYIESEIDCSINVKSLFDDKIKTLDKVNLELILALLEN